MILPICSLDTCRGTNEQEILIFHLANVLYFGGHDCSTLESHVNEKPSKDHAAQGLCHEHSESQRIERLPQFLVAVQQRIGISPKGM